MRTRFVRRDNKDIKNGLVNAGAGLWDYYRQHYAGETHRQYEDAVA